MTELGVGAKAPEEFNVLIDIRRNEGQNKYEMDKSTGYMTLDRVNGTMLRYPTDYGYVPGTLCEDGDAIDTLLVIDESVPHNVVVHCRTIGVLRMVDEGEADEKLVCVAVDDVTKAHINEVEDLGPNFKPIVEHFFAHYKDWKKNWSGGGTVTFDGWGNAAEAKEVLNECIKRYEDQSK